MSNSFCNPMDCSLPGVFQARILEWVAISFSRRSSQIRCRTQVSCIGGQVLYKWATWDTQSIHSHILSEFPFKDSVFNTLMIHWHWTHATSAVTHARMKLKKTSIFSTGITAFLHLGSLQGTSALHLSAIATVTLPTRSKTMRKMWHQVDGRMGTCLQYQSWNEKVESPCSSAVRTWTSGLHTSHWLLCTIWGYDESTGCTDLGAANTF